MAPHDGRVCSRCRRAGSRFRQSIRDAPPFLRRLSLVDLSRAAKSLRDVFTWMLDGHPAAARRFAVDEFPAIVRAATGVEVGAI